MYIIVFGDYEFFIILWQLIYYISTLSALLEYLKVLLEKSAGKRLYAFVAYSENELNKTKQAEKQLSCAISPMAWVGLCLMNE